MNWWWTPAKISYPSVVQLTLIEKLGRVVHHAICDSLLCPIFWCSATLSHVADDGVVHSQCLIGGVSVGDRLQLQQTRRVAMAL